MKRHIVGVMGWFAVGLIFIISTCAEWASQAPRRARRAASFAGRAWTLPVQNQFWLRWALMVGLGVLSLLALERFVQ